MGQPLAVAAADVGPHVEAVQVAVGFAEARIPDTGMLARRSVQGRLVDLGVAETGGAHRGAVAAGEAARGYLVPARMFQPAHQTVAQRVAG